MKNLIKFSQQLKAWREERHLSIEEQRQNYIRNVMEDLGELAVAIKNDDDNAKIDTLCGIMVFALNCFGDISNISYDNELYLVNNNNANENKRLECMLNNLWSIYKCHYLGDLKSIYENIKHLAKFYGYNFDLAMKEYIKELLSGSGFQTEDELQDDVNENPSKYGETYGVVSDLGNKFVIESVISGYLPIFVSKGYKANYKKARIKE